MAVLRLNEAGQQFFVRRRQIAIFVQIADDVLGGLAQSGAMLSDPSCQVR